MSKRCSDERLLRSTVYIPWEMVLEVLYRLPTKSLCRFKCVSTSWKSLISSPDFARTHLSRTKTNNPKHLARTVFLMCAHDFYSLNFNDAPIIATKMDLPSLQPPGGELQMLGSCDGLLLVSVGGSNFFLLNPSTGECKTLPTLSFELDAGRGYCLCLYGVGYDSYTRDYKVVMVFYHENADEDEDEDESPKNMMIVAVYSLKSNAWKKIQHKHRIVDGTAFGVWFNGRLHWICKRFDSILILALDLADGIFRELQFSSTALFVDEDIPTFELVVLGGRLCLVYKLNGNEFGICTLEENEGSMSLSKIWTGSPGISDMDIPGLLAKNEVLSMMKAKILPEITGDILVASNPRTRTLRNIVVFNILDISTSWAMYVESLISPNQE